MKMVLGATVSAILYPKLNQPALIISTTTSKREIGWHTNNCKRLLLLHSQSQKSLALAQEAQCPNPETLEQAAEQAQLAIDNAILDGKRLQLLDLLLPIDQRQFNYLDTEPRDYPCGINAEFLACCKVMTLVMRGLKVAGPEAEILSRKIGEFQNEMDPVGLLYPSNKSVAAVVFPIAESLKKVRSLVEDEPNRPIFLVNPQWRASGQVVSDFGFGPWRRQAELFLEKFERTYALFEQRIGEASNVISGSGGVVRILKCYPYDWHVYLMAWDGTSDLIALLPDQPSYKELEKIVAKARETIPWKAPPRILGGTEPAPPPLPKSLSGFLSNEEIDAMDAIELRRALMALNFPSSGRIAVLKERLKDAQLNKEEKLL